MLIQCLTHNLFSTDVQNFILDVSVKIKNLPKRHSDASHYHTLSIIC